MHSSLTTTDRQLARPILIDLYRQWSHAQKQFQDKFGGGMRYEMRSNGEYLHRRWITSDGRKTAKSYGKRSQETDRIFADFSRQRSFAEAGVYRRRALLNEAAESYFGRFGGDLPLTESRILRRLDALDKTWVLVGSLASRVYALDRTDLPLPVHPHGKSVVAVAGPSDQHTRSRRIMMCRAVERSLVQADRSVPVAESDDLRVTYYGLGLGEYPEWIMALPPVDSVVVSEDGILTPVRLPHPLLWAACEVMSAKNPVSRRRELSGFIEDEMLQAGAEQAASALPQTVLGLLLK